MTTPVPAALRDRPLAIVDVEGNGAQPPEIVEIAVLPVDGPVTPAAMRTWLVRPKNPVTSIARRLHGLDTEQLRHCPWWQDIAEQVQPLLDGRTMIAHAAGVDYRVLAAHLPTWQPPLVLDTLKLARHVWPELPGHRLTELAAHTGITGEQTDDHRPHRAGYDTWCTWQLLQHLLHHSDPSWDKLVDIAALRAFRPPTRPQAGLW